MALKFQYDQSRALREKMSKELPFLYQSWGLRLRSWMNEYTTVAALSCCEACNSSLSPGRISRLYTLDFRATLASDVADRIHPDPNWVSDFFNL